MTGPPKRASVPEGGERNMSVAKAKSRLSMLRNRTPAQTSEKIQDMADAIEELAKAIEEIEKKLTPKDPMVIR
jgi:hypothetical protein